MRRLALFIVALAALVGGTIALVLVLTRGGETTDLRGARAPEGFSLPGFSLRDADGGRVARDDLRGKASVVTFLESRCKEACPVIATQVSRALAMLSPAERSRVAALAISTNPRDDTPASVRAFLRREHADPALRYLIGTERELRPVWKAFLVASALDSGDADVHSAPVRLYDRSGRWVSTFYAGVNLTPAALRHDLLEVLG